MIKVIRPVGSRSLSEATAEQPVRCGFLDGTTAYDCVAPYVSNIDVVYADSLSDVYRLFEEKQIDAFIVDGAAEAAFDHGIFISADHQITMGEWLDGKFLGDGASAMSVHIGVTDRSAPQS